MRSIRQGFLTSLDNVLTVGELARVKGKLASLTLVQAASYKEREEGVRNSKVGDFPKAFWQWYDYRKNCVKIASAYVEET